MLEIITNDPEMMKNLVILVIITPFAIIADRMSKRLPDFTEEEGSEK